MWEHVSLHSIHVYVWHLSFWEIFGLQLWANLWGRAFTWTLHFVLLQWLLGWAEIYLRSSIPLWIYCTAAAQSRGKRPKLPLSLGTVLMHYSPQWSKIGLFFRLLIWFRLKQLNSVHINMFTERKSTAKWVQSRLLTLLLGAHSLGRGPCERGATSNAAKRGDKASYMFTGHTAFLRIKLFCKEKLFIERSHLLLYSVCNNH